MIIGAASSSTTSTILVCLVWSRYSLLRGLRSSLCFVFRVETHTIQLLQLQQIPFLFQINTIQATHFSIVCRTENSLNLCFSFWYVFLSSSSSFVCRCCSFYLRFIWAGCYYYCVRVPLCNINFGFTFWIMILSYNNNRSTFLIST